MSAGLAEDGFGALPYSRWEGRAELATTIGTLLAIAILAYALLVWPLVFGSSEEELSEQVFGWLVNPPPKDESFVKQLAYPIFFLVGAACFALSGAYRRAPWTAPLTLVLAAFVALAAASSAWSVFPAESFKRGALCGLVIATFFFAAFTARDYGTIAKGLFWTLFVSALLNVAAVVLKPPSPIGYTGIYPHKNFFGFVAALIFYFGIHGLTLGSWVYRIAAIPMVILGPIFLVASGSKTSVGLAGLAPIAALGMCWLRRRFGVSPLAAVVVSLILLLFAFWLGRDMGLWDFELLNEKLLGSATLTGRTEIWAIAGSLIGERPLLGWGYEAVWNMGAEGVVTKRAVGFARTMPTAHNGYIDILTQLGLVGFGLLLAFVGLVLAGLGRLIDANPRLGWFASSVTIFVLLHNNLESDVLISSNQLSMVLLLYTFMGMRVVGETAAARTISPRRARPLR